MKITQLQTFLVNAEWKNLVFIEISTDEGISGVGEATITGGLEKPVEATVLNLRRFILGENPFNIAKLWIRMYSLIHDSRQPGTIHSSAISGIEMALWDIIGKKLNTPVYNLLGGRCRDRIRVYANCHRFFRLARKPADYAKKAVEAIERGFTALKWDPFGSCCTTISESDLRKTIEIVKAVRNAVGDDVDLCIEAHGRFNSYTAIKIVNKLEKYNPLWFEEPVPPENIEALAEVKKKVAVPIASGERLFTKYGFRELLEKRAADIIQPDVVHVGGILEIKNVGAMADAYYVPVAPHNPNGPIATSATIQVAAFLPNFLILEFFLEDFPWLDKLISPPLKIEKGYVDVPTKPGLGINLNKNAIMKYPYKDVPPPLKLNEEVFI